MVLAPDPDIAPGLMIQVPAGKPDNTTLPVATEHVGCVMAPATGAAGVTGCAFITIFAEAAEIQAVAFVMVYVYVPVAKPDIVVLAPLPEIAPGLIVQVPAGKPVNTTLPVAVVQVGCVMVPIAGTAGVKGCALIKILLDAGEVHPATLVTVKL